jgi:hypothetical protein
MRYALLICVSAAVIGMSDITVRAQASPAVMQATSDPYAAPITEAAQRFRIPVTWIRAIMRIESHGDQYAVSPKGAMGLMQLMPKTWAMLRVRYGLGNDPFNPRDNILAGVAFLREMHDRYGSPGFLAAYNAGPGRYEDYRDRHRPLPTATIAYIAALIPFVWGGAINQPIRLANSDPPAWTRAPLFITRSENAEPVDRATSKTPSTSNPDAVVMRDLSAFAPQSDGLFAVLSTTGHPQ